ncbi:MAG: glycoside hydrolase family 3 C-terminal domain-containing protein [Alistipes sp.]|nr:glycoside hydrolase family 3 C-terminal domain-containing protein [Alistipes sp.]
MKRLLILLGGIFTFVTLSAQPITDEAKSRAAELVSKMTLEEKLDYIGGYNSFYIRAIPRLGIPEIRMADGPQGVRNNTQSTMFASGIAAAATWNREAVYNMGVGLGQDSRARGVHILLGPGVNIYRSPLCGRNFEYFGEDPYLAAQTAVQYIKGVQSQGTMACIKHYAANNQEWDRHNVSSDVDERTLHEIYLPAFRAAVEQAGVGSLMCSYNLVNSVHASEDKYLSIEVLRNMWGFEGILMSDWNATYSAINAANGGLDLEMPSGKLMNYKHLHQAVADGVVDVRNIDKKVQHILQTLISFGFFDRPQKDESISERNPFSDNASLELARNGVVMLKNDGILPFKKGKVVVGGMHANTVPTGGGSGFVHPFETCSVSEGLSQVKGYKVFTTNNLVSYSLEGKFYTSADLAQAGLKAEYFNNVKLEGTPVHTSVETTINKNWKKGSPKAGVVNADKFSIRWSGVLCVPEREQMTITVRGDDGYRMFIDGKQVLAHWSNHGVSQRTYTFTAEANQKYDVRIEYFDNSSDARVHVNFYNNSYVEQNAAAIRSANAVVMCVGFDSNTEKENSDRTFELPYDQGELIRKVAAINPNVIAVVNAGGGFEMASWMDSAKAILLAWYPGQEGGQAIAEIISGKISPSGRLPISIERKLEDNPTWGSYYHNLDVKVRNNPYLRVNYKEGLFLGYRGYDRKEVKPLFPFGFGLTYTTFKYSNLNVTPTQNGYLVEFDVTNTGKVAAAEVAQVYVGYNDESVPHPVKQLKGYDKVTIAAGKTHHFAVELPASELTYYDIISHSMVDASKDVVIYVGSSAEEIHLQQTATR